MYISDVMKQTGLTRKAVYLYEERGLLTPEKVKTGEQREYREYTQEDVDRLRLVARLRELDVSLSDIKKAVDGQSLDIILQNHLDKARARLNEMKLTVEKLTAALNELPPNGDSTQLAEVLDRVIAGPEEQALAHKLENDYSTGGVRRMAVMMYEAFLDKPLDTKERWDAWYNLLEELERHMTPELVEAHSEFYGGMTTEQLCEDYALRKRLVCGYANYGPMEEKAKANELLQELWRLEQEQEAFDRWQNYYGKMVESTLRMPLVGIMDWVRELSCVYDQYERHFIEMRDQYLAPHLAEPKNAALKSRLESKMNCNDLLDFTVLIYFDFYNNTLRRILYPEMDR